MKVTKLSEMELWNKDSHIPLTPWNLDVAIAWLLPESLKVFQ